MDISIDFHDNGKKLLSKVDNLDVIQIGTEQIAFSYYVVFDKDIDESIPALLLQLWRFEGGYDHAVVNLLENDLGVNSLVTNVQVAKLQGTVKKIINYRSNIEKLSEKELYFYDVVPNELRNQKDQEFSIPYECAVLIDEDLVQVNLPSWTPKQNLPNDRITIGSILEIWRIDNVTVVMKVLRV